MPTSAMTSQYQATVPKAVRETLQLDAGDRIDFTIESDGRVWLQKAVPAISTELQALEATLAPEWNSEFDDRAYRDL